MGVIVGESIGGSDEVTGGVSDGGSDDDGGVGSCGGSVAVSAGGVEDGSGGGSDTGTTVALVGVGVPGTPMGTLMGTWTEAARTGLGECVSVKVSASIAERVGSVDGVEVPGRSHGAERVAKSAGGGGPVSPGAS